MTLLSAAEIEDTVHMNPLLLQYCPNHNEIEYKLNASFFVVTPQLIIFEKVGDSMTA